MSLLLLATEERSDAWVPFVILAVIAVVAVLIVLGLKKVYGKDQGMVTKSEPKVVAVQLKKAFMKPNEMIFLKDLYKILPAEFIAFPHVGVDNIVEPKDNKVLYNTILSQYLDVCVFLKKTMEPVLAIDLYEASPIEQQMKQLHPNVIKALATVKVPLLQYQLSEEYDIQDLRTRVIDAMPSKMVAMLKEKVKNDKNIL